MVIKHPNIKIGWQRLLELPSELVSTCVKEYIRFLVVNDVYDLWFGLLESSSVNLIAERAEDMFIAPISLKTYKELDDQLIERLRQRLILQSHDCSNHPLEILNGMWQDSADKLFKKDFKEYLRDLKK